MNGAEPGPVRELHVVGIYEGKSTQVHGGGFHPVGHAAVLVQRPGKQVTLFLSSYEPVTWHVTIGEGSAVERVFLGGYYRQSVTGLSDGTPVAEFSFENSASDYAYLGYTLDSARFMSAAPKLRALGGLPLSSFHGDYSAPYPAPMLISQVQDDPRLASDYPRPTPLAELPPLAFAVPFFQDNGPVVTGRLGRRGYTLAGPQDGGALLPDLLRVFGDAEGQMYYGLAGDGAVRVTAATGVARSLPVRGNVPELSWPMGVTFDTKRGRLLLASLGGEGFWYEYLPALDQWRKVASLQNADLSCVVYHAPEDALYGLSATFGDYGPPVLSRVDPQGRRTDSFSLPWLPFGLGPGGNQRELVPVGDYLVLLLAPRSYDPMAGELTQSRMYLIEPRHHAVWLTYRSGLAPNTPPVVRLTTPKPGTRLTAPVTIQLVAAASDADGAVESVEFFANGQSLGRGTTSGWQTPRERVFTFEWADARAGQYSLTAGAVDDGRATTLSAPVTITVAGVVPEPGLVIVSPASGTWFTAPVDVLVQAELRQSAEPLRRLEFRADDEQSGAAWLLLLPPSVPGQPAWDRLIWRSVPPGHYTLYASGTLADRVITALPVVCHVQRSPDGGLGGGGPGPGPAGEWLDPVTSLPLGAPPPRFAGVERDPAGALRLSFPALPDVRYLIETSTSLGVATWETAARFVSPGAARQVVVVDNATGGRERFYRLRVGESGP